uniref:Uncharacterized protein n=1 Tax=Setaria viridis TaxID=4556 RepID=A0A4V6D5W5_SETVI|nr:hypothetical protein SEVIR_5G011301v2 [Setaria viridis]
MSQAACGWRHTLTLSEKRRYFLLGRGSTRMLGSGEIFYRNMPGLLPSARWFWLQEVKLIHVNSIRRLGYHKVSEGRVEHGRGGGVGTGVVESETLTHVRVNLK